MAGGLHSSLKPASSSSSNQSFSSKILLLLTLLPFTLASFAFVLQWRGGVTDPSTRYSAEDHKFPGMDSSPPTTTMKTSHLSRSDCGPLLSHSSPSFPYYRDWKFHYQTDLKPKVNNKIFDFLSFCFCCCWSVSLFCLFWFESKWGLLDLVDYWWGFSVDL